VYFQYDAGGERTRKVESSDGVVARETLYLGDQIVERDASGVLELQVRSGVRLLARVQMRSSGKAPLSIACRYPLSSRTGSIAGELGPDGAWLRYEEYYPFGDTSLAISFDDEGSARFQFAGKERDNGTGLYYFGQRYYSPEQGRWTTPDPAGAVDGPNLFAYVSNNPLTLVDPTGTCGDPPQQPQWDFKSTLKKVLMPLTLANAWGDAGAEYLRITKVVPSSLNDVSRVIGLFSLRALAPFAATVGGGAGMAYYAMDIRKYGPNLFNVASFTGSGMFALEGLWLYRALAAGHAALQRAAGIGAVADTLKIPKELHEGNYGKVALFTGLALGNALGALPEHTIRATGERVANAAIRIYERSPLQRRLPLSSFVKIGMMRAATGVSSRGVLLATAAIGTIAAIPRAGKDE
jgi:RHS repeat-associated protein